MFTKIFGLSAQELNALFTEYCQSIKASNPQLIPLGQKHLDNLAKPLGSLGDLEQIALKLFCIFEGDKNYQVEPAMLYTIAADHGVAQENVSAVGQEITRLMLINFLHAGAGINAICKSSGLDFLAVNAGVVGPLLAPHPKLIQEKIADGTKNIAHEAALSKEECLRALFLGLELANKAVLQGYRCLATGEMGIANTTPSAALYCAWFNIGAQEAVGVGSGIGSQQLRHKIELVEKALKLHAKAIAAKDDLQILSSLGGIEIAVMAGIILGAAYNKLPMLIDGFIAGAAYTAAFKFAPAVADYCFFSHASAEQAHNKILQELGVKAILNLNLRLGEGTGAALAYPIVKAAASVFTNMAQLEDVLTYKG